MTAASFVRESLLSGAAGDNVICNVCERRCLIGPGKLGWCRTRRNDDGTLVTLIYGALSSVSADPIEKKPLYHFFPGSHTATAGSWSCNFGCPWCQNWDISKARVPETGTLVTPERFIEVAVDAQCQGISISFNEPTLSLDWSLDVFRLAKERRFYTTYVTNGYMTPESMSLLIDAGLNAMNVDIKGDAAQVRRHCRHIDIEKVWQNCSSARARGVHVEITTLLIPGINDADESLAGIAGRIRSDLGAEVPWHVSAYHPAYRFTTPATPPPMLERAHAIGKEAGLEFVYIGNLPGHIHSSTFCPGCGELLMKRIGFHLLTNDISQGHCPRCSRVIAGVWSLKS
jgi:pyruvate formate lyase activating enzyme